MTGLQAEAVPVTPNERLAVALLAFGLGLVKAYAIRALLRQMRRAA